jgi:hypothetical protein
MPFAEDLREGCCDECLPPYIFDDEMRREEEEKADACRLVELKLGHTDFFWTSCHDNINIASVPCL